MKTIASMLRHRLLLVVGLLAVVECWPSTVASTAVVTTVVLSLSSASEVQALPANRVARRTSRRTTRRVARRHLYGMPPSSVVVPFGAYRYYRYSGIYYYPYMLGGRTTYIEMDNDASGRPLPPPPPEQVEVEIDINVSR